MKDQNTSNDENANEIKRAFEVYAKNTVIEDQDTSNVRNANEVKRAHGYLT